MLFLVKLNPELSLELSINRGQSNFSLVSSSFRLVTFRLDSSVLIGARPTGAASICKVCVHYINIYFSYFSFAEMAHGYVGADLAAVCKEAGLMSFKRCLAEHKGPSPLDDRAREETLKERLLVTREDIMAAFRQVRPSAMREVAIDVPKVSVCTFILCKRLSMRLGICLGELSIFSANFAHNLDIETCVFRHSPKNHASMERKSHEP